MTVVCGTCEKMWRNETPLLVMGENAEGQKTMVEPDPSDDYWLPNCRHNNPKVVTG